MNAGNIRRGHPIPRGWCREVIWKPSGKSPKGVFQNSWSMDRSCTRLLIPVRKQARRLHYIIFCLTIRGTFAKQYLSIIFTSLANVSPSLSHGHCLERIQQDFSRAHWIKFYVVQENIWKWMWGSSSGNLFQCTFNT